MPEVILSKKNDAALGFSAALVSAVAELFGFGHIVDSVQHNFPNGEISLDKKGAVLIKSGADPVRSLRALVSLLIGQLSGGFGEKFAEQHLEVVYERARKNWSDAEISAAIFPLVPEPFLEKYRIASLPSEELQRMVLEKTKRLEEINADLEEKVRLRTERLEALVKEQDASGKLLIRRDLELSRANEKLRALDEAKSNFISVAAHQLRTPLSGIKWTLNLLLRGDLGALAEDQKVFLTKAYESNDRMIALVNDMLSADRVESGKMRYSAQAISALDLLDNVLFEVLPFVNKKRIEVRFKDRGTPLPEVYVDPDRLRAVFQNLLENSLKYTMEEGVIEISLVPKEGMLQISIADNGIGIPVAEQKNVFNRFFRAKNAIKVETDGSGLGLFIVKNIIEREGGKVWFESEEGKGTAFYVTVPVAK